MVDTSHSKSVRGTLSNPKTKQTINSSKPTPDLGDGTSLKPANDDKKSFPSNDSAPPAGQGNDTPSASSSSSSSRNSSDSAPTVSEPYRKAGTGAGGGDKKAIGNGGNVEARNMEDGKQGGKKNEAKEHLPHSKKLRGTLANDHGVKANKTQLGDPASLKAETSKTGDMGRQTEREGQDHSGKSKL
ncbi:hypothetical protein G6011_10434 [Alternaria panax]|uniref:Uncharacterized protein n=1 Tax=Alternaria panax TaxID=48097 RepID=A0AAD4IBU5_9PLEO|nr:hypothetical protein G6011_10434 [Alternaria panax]